MIANTELIIGPPGTGKTTRLLDIMERELANGIEPNRIAFCSFTKKAASEATDRACERFNFKKADMTYFRTIHSMAFAGMGLKREQVMQPADYKKIGKHLGLSFSNKTDWMSDSMAPTGKNPGDQYVLIDGFSRARHLSPRTVWDTLDHDNLNWFEFSRYQDTVVEYKRNKGLYDYADMLVMGARGIDVDVLIIDEAQDLSTAQWHFIRETFKAVQRVYIGGDDDQAIFEWSGADVNTFINLAGKRTVLHQSYRVPKAVHALATGITSQINHRTPKQYNAKAAAGAVDYWMSVDDIDMGTGTWLLLARNSYLLGELGVSTKAKGYNFSIKGKPSISQTDIKAIRVWEQIRGGYEPSEVDTDLLQDYASDLTSTAIWHVAFDKMQPEVCEYYISLLRRGESLTKAPRININTIHGVKGGEADHVVLLTDMAYSTWGATSINPDSEHRVWYVGATRCKESLHIVQPRGRYFYQI